MLQLNVNLFFTIINLVVLYLLLKKFLINPITDIMKKREKMIADEINNAQSVQQEAIQMKQEYEVALSGAREESVKIIEKAQQQAKSEYERIIADADKRAAGILEIAKANVELERNQTMKSLQSEIAGLAVVAATRLVGERSKKQGNQEIYNQFLEEIGDIQDDTDKKGI